MSRGGRLRVGFNMIGDDRWRGGFNYLRGLMTLLGGDLADRFEPVLFVSPEEGAFVETQLGPVPGLGIVVDPRAAGAGQGRRALKAIALGRDAAFADLVREHRIDVQFENARFFGARFPARILSWLPDFQHRRMRHLFPGRAFWQRELGFQAQTRSPRTILLSSRAAEADCLTFYPAARGKTCIARFTAVVDVEAAMARREDAVRRHALPERFFYLPNQFWLHKNHATVVAALAVLKRSGRLDDLPPVILSGPMEDPRDPAHFERTMAEARRQGVDTKFRHLGIIPYADVLALNAACHAMINPSLFEGWATTLEEAKALGTPLILSAIPTQREQARDARFFEPEDAEALADALLAAAATPADRPPVATLLAETAARHRDFVAAIRSAFDQRREPPADAGFGQPVPLLLSRE